MLKEEFCLQVSCALGGKPRSRVSDCVPHHHCSVAVPEHLCRTGPPEGQERTCPQVNFHDVGTWLVVPSIRTPLPFPKGAQFASTCYALCKRPSTLGELFPPVTPGELDPNPHAIASGLETLTETPGDIRGGAF